MVKKIGIDLGYANIAVCDVTQDVFREPSVALIHKNSRAGEPRIISIGNEAFGAGQGAAAEGMLVRPFKNGMFFDHQITEEVITRVIEAHKGNADKLRCVIGVPSDILTKQEKDLFSMLQKAGVATSYSVVRPVAAIIGAGYSPNMSVISVNIGAMSTEIAVMHGGKAVYLSRTEIGGEDFDKAVRQFVLEQGDVNISLSVARAIKERLGAVWKGRPNDSIDIEGTLALTGNRLKMNVSTEDIVGVFEKPMQDLIYAIIDAVKKVPLDSVEAVFENGIVLTGGGAELYGIDILLARVLGISVTKPQTPIDCVAKGLARINAFIQGKSRGGSKNITDQLARLYNESRK